MIVLSAKTDHKKKKKVEPAGYVFLEKPVEIDNLVSEIGKSFKTEYEKN